MIQSLQTKCENLMTFITSNLYIHTSDTNETLRYIKLNIPGFLSKYIEESISKLIHEKEVIQMTNTKSNDVYYYIDPFKMGYLTWLIESEGQHFTITLGPLTSEKLTGEEIKYMGYQMKLSSDNCFLLEQFYTVVPYFDQMQLIRIASMFLDYLAVKPHLPKIIREDHSIANKEELSDIESKFKAYDFVAHNYEIEGHMLHAIETGDVDAINEIIQVMKNKMGIPARFPGDPLRERKNLAITSNSIALRAAIKGGLDQNMGHSLSHAFAIQIENQHTPEQLNKLQQKIILTYTESVKKYTTKGYSPLISNSIHYIRTHLTNAISLIQIAETLHVSKEHLSRQFKEEVGDSITHFIHKSKIKESCSLLKSKRYTISDLAYTFGYSSPAHYSKIFKQHMGISPKAYQSEQAVNA